MSGAMFARRLPTIFDGDSSRQDRTRATGHRRWVQRASCSDSRGPEREDLNSTAATDAEATMAITLTYRIHFYWQSLILSDY